MLNWHIGDIIRKLRESQQKRNGDKTIPSLAGAVGITAYWMGQIEATGKCNTTTLEHIARALNTTVDFIYSELPQPAPLQHSEGPALCCEAHKNLHVLLNKIMHGKRSDAEFWRQGITTNLVAMSRAATASEESLPPAVKKAERRIVNGADVWLYPDDIIQAERIRQGADLDTTGKNPAKGSRKNK